MATDTRHKYNCARCSHVCIEDTVNQLAFSVNRHMTLFHPMDYCAWTAEQVVGSPRYSGPATAPAPGAMPAYLVKHGTAQNSLHHLTDEDKAFLHRARVKW